MNFKRILPMAAMIIGFSVFVCLMVRSTQNIGLQTAAAPQQRLPDVLIDPGHGGEDGGAVSGNILEKEINLDISHNTADLLKLLGFHVTMTRETDDALTNEGEDVKKRKYNDMKMRLGMYNSSENNVIISIHQNKFSNASSHGTQVFYSPHHKNSAYLADCIKFAVNQSVQPDNDRENKAAGKEIYLLYNTHNPAVLVECGFISNHAEREKLLNPEYQKQMSMAIAAGFIDYCHTG